MRDIQLDVGAYQEYFEDFEIELKEVICRLIRNDDQKGLDLLFTVLQCWQTWGQNIMTKREELVEKCCGDFGR